MERTLDLQNSSHFTLKTTEVRRKTIANSFDASLEMAKEIQPVRMKCFGGDNLKLSAGQHTILRLVSVATGSKTLPIKNLFGTLILF